jgi:hypothetical protein
VRLHVKTLRDTEYLDGAMRGHAIVFFGWLTLLNWPPLLTQIPPFRALCFLPYLSWINIPALWLGLARFVGPPHYDIQEFGARPQTGLAWLLIVAFWVLIAAGLTVITALFLRLFQRSES